MTCFLHVNVQRMWHDSHTWHYSWVCNASVTRFFHARNELRVRTTHTHPLSFSRTAFLCDITHSFVTRFGHRGWQAISCEGVGNGNSCASCHRNTHTLPPSHTRRLYMCHNPLIRDMTQSSEVRVRQERVVFALCVMAAHTHSLSHTPPSNLSWGSSERGNSGACACPHDAPVCGSPDTDTHQIIHVRLHYMRIRRYYIHIRTHKTTLLTR